MSLSMTNSAVKSREHRRTSAAYMKRVHSAEYKARRAEQMRKWRLEHPCYDRTNAERSKRYQLKHPEKIAAKYRRIRQREVMLMATDATYAEFCREKNRQANRRSVDKTRIVPYRPMLSRRIPAWVPYGVNPIDRSSPYLRNNMDANAIRSCDNYAMKLAVERRERRCASVRVALLRVRVTGTRTRYGAPGSASGSRSARR